jgi:hypothetical protein
VANINSFLKQLVAGDSLRGYAHANKIFTNNAFDLSPKFAFLFHVHFDLAPGVTYNRQSELGVLVKSVDLPKYRVDTKTYNSYNRPNIVQSKIKYEPITITFHDDTSNVIRNFWYDYYTFYYRDTDLANPSSYQNNYKYAKENIVDTAYMGYTTKNDQKRYLQSIRIYSFSKKKASEYVLINPIITSFQHGRHENQTDNTTLEHTMTIEYESVIYNEGPSSAAAGFAKSNIYDTKPSPIAPGGAGTRSILGPGGLLGTANNVMKNLSEGNFLSAALGAAKGVKTFKGANLKDIALTEVKGLGTDILRGQNPLSRIQVPSLTDLGKNADNLGSKIKSSLTPSGTGSSPVVDRPVVSSSSTGSTGRATSNSEYLGGP